MGGSPVRSARPGRRAVGTGLCLAAVTVLVASLVGAGPASGAVTAPNVNVSVGYADTVHGSFLPSPWNGDPGVIFAGDSGAASFDAGAVRVEVPADGAPVTVEDVSVDVGSYHYAIWGGFLPVTIQPGEQLVLTSTDGQNFNTSDTSDGCANNGVIPAVHLTIASATFDYADQGQILNTGGRDLWTCLEQNEGNQWSTVGEADVGVSLAAKPQSVSPGQNVEFASTVTNYGPAAATNVQLFEGLPSNGTFVSATPSQGSCQLGEGGVFCSLGTLSSDASATVGVVVTTPSEPASVSSNVEVSADQFDPNGDNNSAGATADPCTTDCTGGWVNDGGTVAGPPIGGDVTQSATIIAPRGVHGPVSSTNSETSPCQEPPTFETYGRVFIVEGPVATGRHVYLNRYRFVTSTDPSIGVPPHEPLRNIKLLRMCVEIPRCLIPHRRLASIPSGFLGCVYKVHRNRLTKVVTISELDTGNDPPIRGGG
jgi:uncharacterized repeat protein (TIGR01451 family)